MNASLCYTCWRPTEFCICAACSHVAPASCAHCDGQAADALDALFGDFGPVGEACAGLDWDGLPCPRRAETGSARCDLHTAPGVARLPIPIPIVRIEVAA